MFSVIHRRHLLVSLLCISALAASGCFSSGSSSGSDAPAQSNGLEGLVTDPPIAGAAVWLEATDGEVLTNIARTDERGRFELEAPASLDSGARLVATGGVDTRTGHSFQGVMLGAGVRDGQSRQVVTPLTRLVDVRAQSAGAQSAAAEYMGQLLDLDPDALLGDPAAATDVQRASLLVTELVMAMQGVADPFERLADALEGTGGNFANAASALGTDSSLPGSVRDRLLALEGRLAHLQDLQVADADAMIGALNRANLEAGLTGYLERQLGVPVNGDPLAGNLEELAHAVWQASGRRGMPADGPAIVNVARYLFQQYDDAISSEALADDGFSVPQGLRDDAQVSALAATQVIDHTLPLAPDETLGMDNAARAAYFFGSDLSPYYRAARLFDAVFDDATTDPVFARIARGQAAAGRVEEASLTLETRIFQPAERAEARRLVGEALFRNGDTGAALEQWRQSRAIYQGILDRKGVTNLEAEDARFLARLSGNFGETGKTDEAERTLEAVRTFIDIEGGRNQPYSDAYRSIALAGYDNARLAVEQFQAAPGESGRRARAESAMALAQELIWGIGTEPNPIFARIERVYSTRTQHVAQYGELAARLGLNTEAQRSATEFESLLETSDNLDAAGLFLTNMAAVYDFLDRVEDYAALVDRGDALDGPGDWSRAASPRAEIRLLEARALALEGDVDAAIDEALDARADPDGAARIRDLTFNLISRESLQPQSPRLALSLVDAGQLAAARQVTEAAAGIALSDAFADEQFDGSNDWQYVYLGCRRVAFMFELAEAPDRAVAHLRSCADAVASRMASAPVVTADRAEATRLLAAGHLFLGDVSGARDRAQEFATIGEAFTGVERVANRGQLAQLQSGAGDYADALRSLDAAADAMTQIATPGSDEQALLQASRWFTRGGSTTARGSAANDGLVIIHAQVADAVRERVAAGAQVSANDLERVQAARDKGVELVEGANGSSGALALIEALPNQDDRDLEIREIVSALAQVRGFDVAKRLAGAEDRSSERNRLLRTVAESLTELDDYPGTAIARFDFDGDGQADFFNPRSSESERLTAGIAMDSDIDGDAIPDSDDLTPYCPASRATCWQP
ncbi:carboxypeptidase-like regulatory domain-containing protein [Aquisalimonas asiatica]|uniref:Tetratricopeptide repeat-containing protein n=1 Tax=Aquisalimonas asiatica TaxID=406100 RepID=A0A1H8TZ23_9GAMM|nr:carboxypeptidase-like regulatory domain-containing protein [Aquisalimonas asiatica]SEO96282.1 hypothetical protein SAMN04488052_10556 [Aquisalimonas asiatica]